MISRIPAICLRTVTGHVAVCIIANRASAPLGKLVIHIMGCRVDGLGTPVHLRNYTGLLYALSSSALSADRVFDSVEPPVSGASPHTRLAVVKGPVFGALTQHTFRRSFPAPTSQTRQQTRGKDMLLKLHFRQDYG